VAQQSGVNGQRACHLCQVTSVGHARSVSDLISVTPITPPWQHRHDAVKDTPSRFYFCLHCSTNVDIFMIQNPNSFQCFSARAHVELFARSRTRSFPFKNRRIDGRKCASFCSFWAYYVRPVWRWCLWLTQRVAHTVGSSVSDALLSQCADVKEYVEEICKGWCKVFNLKWRASH